MEHICLVLFTEHGPDTELQAINTDFTFELFICAAILLENRESLLQCRDEVQLIQFTSRLVCTMRRENLIMRQVVYECAGETFAFFCAAFRENWI